VCDLLGKRIGRIPQDRQAASRVRPRPLLRRPPRRGRPPGEAGHPGQPRNHPHGA